MSRCPCGLELGEGERRIDVSLAVSWGTDDERADHAKTTSFCSFQHLAKWAAEKALDHDGRVLRTERRLEGSGVTATVGLPPADTELP